MDKRLLFTVLLLSLSAVGKAYQAKTDTLKLFYAIDEKDAARHHNSLDSLFSVGGQTIRNVKIIGYSDYLGSKKHNALLSLQRAENIKAYFLSVLPTLQVSVTGKGEVINAAAAGKLGVPNDRRVDLIYNIERKQLALQPPVDPQPATDTAFVQRATPQQKIDKLNTLNPGESLDLNELFFQPGRHLLLPESYPYLNTLLDLLKKNSKLRIEIVGHICCDYSVEDGLDYDTQKLNLSESRAKFLYDYLVKEGIARRRMKYKGVGSSKPKVYPELTKNDQVLNRRVEIVVLSK